ncbi:MAG: twin-arginine translocase TatA/TatE family subunit [Acidimicrobiaceae bacterium]|nr:twin-arginine translocase TatA/TatE family subunit [Acidimicrobiaceae bacterium]
MSFSPEKLFVVGVIALIVLGPHRLPEAARTLGRFVATFRHLTASLQGEVRDALREPKDAFNAALNDFNPDHNGQIRRAPMRTRNPNPPTPPDNTAGSETVSAEVDSGEVWSDEAWSDDAVSFN